MSPKDCAYIVERLAIRFMAMVADHERQLSEHRTSFGARTEADAKIIAGLREEVKRLQWENATMHQDAEDGYAEAIKVLGDPIALSKERDALQERLRASIARGDFAQMEVAALKSQNPKQHPVKVGEWVRRTDAECDGIYFGRGVIAQVLDILDAPENQYTVSRPEWNGYTVPWAMQYCEPCDPPEATHDTEAGKAAAESGLLLNGGLDVRKVTT